MIAVQTRLFNADGGRRADIVRIIAERLAGDADVSFAYLHGSFNRLEPFHDIDVAVFLDPLSRARAAKLLELADVLSRASGYPVDVRALNEAPVAFQFRAIQGTLLVSRKEEQVADFRERTGFRYADLAPRLRQAARDAFAR